MKIYTSKAGRISVALIATFALVLSVLGGSFVRADHTVGTPYANVVIGGPGENDPSTVEICHATSEDNENNPYISNSPNLSSFFAPGNGHDDDLQDIIPPFHYQDGDDVLSFEGSNWNGEFIEIWENECDVPDVVGTGSITIVKEIAEGSDVEAQFDFAAEWVDGDIDFTLGDGGNWTSDPLEAGSYSLSEIVPDGWEFPGIVCSDQSVGDDGAVTIDLAEGEDVTCTYTNTEIPEVDDTTITVIKQTLPDGNETSFDFLLDAGALDSLSDGQSTTTVVSAGTHTLTEIGLQEWDLTDITCLDESEVEVVPDSEGEGAITLTLTEGDDVTCTFTNTQVPPPGTGTIVIVKDVAEGGNLSQLFTFDGSWMGGADFLLGDGQSTTTVQAAGAYSIFEESALGWSTSVSCEVTGGEQSTFSPTVGGGTITLAEGETMTCTFLNTQLTDGLGSITIRKEATPEDGTNFGFTFGESVFTLDDMGAGDDADGFIQQQTFDGLVAGSYTVNEIVPEGWTLADVSCSEGTTFFRDPGESDIEVVLAADQDVTCTYTNRQTPTDPGDDDDDDSSGDDDDDDNGGGGRSGSSRRGNSGDGEVAGASTSAGEVLQAQTSVLPAGAPATGMGGAADAAYSFGSFFSLFAGLKF